MNRERAARAYDLIAEGFAELAVAVREPVDSPVARSGDAGAEGAGTSSAPALPSFDELPPEGFEVEQYESATGHGTRIVDPPALKPQVDAGLGICPIHGKRWTVKAAGVSATGKPYEAFWKCSEKDDDGYCKQKPQKIWRDTHPAEAVAA